MPERGHAARTTKLHRSDRTRARKQSGLRFVGTDVVAAMQQAAQDENLRMFELGVPREAVSHDLVSYVLGS